MKSAQKNRPAVTPAVVSAVEPLEGRALFSASPVAVSDSPTDHAVQTVTAQNGAMNSDTPSLNFTKISYGLMNRAAGA